jgi:tetratricopeptide (TPR) repeat protein
MITKIMKTTLIYLVCSVLLMNSCKGDIRYSEKDRIAVKLSQEASLKSNDQNDTLLKDIQSKVMDAFVNAKISNSDKSLLVLEQALLNLNKNNTNGIILYWYSYACYYHSILLTIEKENKSSERILDEGIRQFKNAGNLNSEHFALLALMESYSIQYAPAIEVPSISKHVKQNAEKALQLDSLNPRAYFVLGSNDFYTPEQYGGGKKAESYLIKAIGLNDQSVVNPYLPTWGKNGAYEMLIRLYINHKQFAEAKKYYQEAITKFPDDYMINKLAKELINY